MQNLVHVFLATITSLVMAQYAVASAETRTALVIGISAYDVRELAVKNPTNDARSLAEALARSGFAVSKELDADLETFNRAVDAFSSASRNAEVALFFFAGHGMQVDGQNYLVPKDARLNSRSDVERATISADSVLKRMTAGRDGKISILMLDACRNNPLASQGISPAAGLAIQPVTGPGKYIVFSTDPGLIARDGPGK